MKRADIIVFGLVCSLLFTGLLAAEQKANESQLRVTCKKNLMQIGLAMQIYANDNKGAFPRTLYDPEKSESVTAFSGADSAKPFGNKGPSANDVTGPLYLLLRTGDLKSDVFVCPSSRATRLEFAEGKRIADFSNFTSLEHLSYSYTNPYPGETARRKGFKFDYTVRSSFAVAGDLNPGGEALAKLAPDAPAAEMMKGNSANHMGEGQNVLYGDGHVEWTTTPFCGQPRADRVRDNVYTRHLPPGAAKDADPIMGPPMDAEDSVLLPSADVVERAAPAAKARRAADNLPAKDAKPADGGAAETEKGDGL